MQILNWLFRSVNMAFDRMAEDAEAEIQIQAERLGF
jgi:hypothetical protein